MSEEQRPEIPDEDYKKPLSKGGDLPPLELLPAREWLGAKIVSVEYRVCQFNGKIQYMTKKEYDETEKKEVEIQILDKEGDPIPRREFYITFEFHTYTLPNGSPRKAWLQIGASLGDKAHLPTLLYNILGENYVIDTPQDVIDGLQGKDIKLQLKNKPSKTPDKPPTQKVVYDAVEKLDAPETPPPATPMNEADVEEPPAQQEDKSSGEYCHCGEKAKPVRTEKNGQIMDICSVCDKVVTAWDE
jgi:hypothetical protein